MLIPLLPLILNESVTQLAMKRLFYAESYGKWVRIFTKKNYLAYYDSYFLSFLVDTPVGKILRITRSCGYIRNENEEKDRSCFKASFSASTSSRYCACEDNKCNAGEIKLPSILLIMTSVVYALTMIVFIV